MPGKATPGIFNANNPKKGGQAKPNFSAAAPNYAALAKKLIGKNAKRPMTEQRRMDIANKSRSTNPNFNAENRQFGRSKPHTGRGLPRRDSATGKKVPPPLFRTGRNMTPMLNRKTQV